MKQIKFLVLGVLFLVAGFLLGYGLNTGSEVVAQAQSVRTESTASIMVDTGDALLGFPERAIYQGDTIWSLLERAAEENQALSVFAQDYGDLGVLIQSINGYENGAEKKYWQFWVNNEYAQVAADKYFVNDGDAVMWKFTSGRFTEY